MYRTLGRKQKKIIIKQVTEIKHRTETQIQQQ